MEITIVSPGDSEPTFREQLYRGAEHVFWETAVIEEVPSGEERRRFRYKYFDYYRDAAPDLFLVALEDEHVYGYICGVADTRTHRELYQVAEHVPVFDDLYERFPAHLHINLDAKSRGMGLGSRLIRAFEEQLVLSYRIGGLHLVTSEGARNASFYRRNGFDHEIARGLPETGAPAPRMLFMGKTL